MSDADGGIGFNRNSTFTYNRGYSIKNAEGTYQGDVGDLLATAAIDEDPEE